MDLNPELPNNLFMIFYQISWFPEIYETIQNYFPSIIQENNLQ